MRKGLRVCMYLFLLSLVQQKIHGFFVRTGSSQEKIKEWRIRTSRQTRSQMLCLRVHRVTLIRAKVLSPIQVIHKSIKPVADCNLKQLLTTIYQKAPTFSNAKTHIHILQLVTLPVTVMIVIITVPQEIAGR